MKKQYWAVGLNFNYGILAHEPDVTEYGSVEGPFDSLAEAKAQVRDWIRGDREELAGELRECMKLKAKEIE